MENAPDNVRVKIEEINLITTYILHSTCVVRIAFPVVIKFCVVIPFPIPCICSFIFQYKWDAGHVVSRPRLLFRAFLMQMGTKDLRRKWNFKCSIFFQTYNWNLPKLCTKTSLLRGIKRQRNRILPFLPTSIQENKI